MSVSYVYNGDEHIYKIEEGFLCVPFSLFLSSQWLAFSTFESCGI